MISVGVMEYDVKRFECDGSKVFGSRNAVKNDSFVIWNAVQKVKHKAIVSTDKKRVIP